MADIVIVNPNFEMSFWGLQEGLRFLGKQANMPVGALPLLASLTPPEHRVTLIDENVEELDFDRRLFAKPYLHPDERRASRRRVGL